MKNRTDVFFHIPQPEDLWFREALLADPDTMSYNSAWGGTVAFPREKWGEWYERWIGRPDKCFYRYVAAGKSRSFVGEAAWHYEEGRGIYLTDVIILSKCRGRGYGRAGLELLCEAAREAGIRELYDEIAAGNPGIALFLECGFREECRTDGTVTVKKIL